MGGLSWISASHSYIYLYLKNFNLFVFKQSALYRIFKFFEIMIRLDYFSYSLSPSNPPIYTSLSSFKFMESFFIKYCYKLIIFIGVCMNVSLCTWELCQQRPEETIRSIAAVSFPKIGFLYVALAVLELAWYTKLSLNSLRSTYLCSQVLWLYSCTNTAWLASFELHEKSTRFSYSDWASFSCVCLAFQVS